MVIPLWIKIIVIFAVIVWAAWASQKQINDGIGRGGK